MFAVTQHLKVDRGRTVLDGPISLERITCAAEWQLVASALGIRTGSATRVRFPVWFPIPGPFSNPGISGLEGDNPGIPSQD